MARITQAAVRNRLLAALPPDDFARIAGSLQPVELDFKHVLLDPGEPIEAAWFVESGVVSMLVRLEGGESQEVGLIGREGLVGLPLVFGSEPAATEALVQLQGTALRLPAAALRDAFEASADVRRPLLRYMQAFHAQVSQTAACNGRHPLEERLARWLLMTHDRAESDVFPMTQEFISTMLGVRRAGVTVAAGLLQRTGVISYDRGQITVLHRRQLEASSCECYRIVQRQLATLLP